MRNYPSGLDPVLDLQSTINKYCELSPDKYAHKNYRSTISEVENPWQIAQASWDWLHRRLTQDRSELVSIGDCQHGEWWEDWDFVEYRWCDVNHTNPYTSEPYLIDKPFIKRL